MIPTTHTSSIGDKSTTISKPKVFLAHIPSEYDEVRRTLKIMLTKAGFEVLPDFFPEDEVSFQSTVELFLSQSAVSIHPVGNFRGFKFTNGTWSQEFQLSIALQKSQSSEFKIVIWQFENFDTTSFPLLEKLTNQIAENVLFTNVTDYAQLIDDFRAFWAKDLRNKQKIKENELCIICNDNDKESIIPVIAQLQNDKKIKLEFFVALPENGSANRNLVTELVYRSKVVIIFFNDSSDWALAFAKQVWRLVGGASANTPFLLVGENEPRRNRLIKFQAPNLFTRIVPLEQVESTILEFYQAYQENRLPKQHFCPFTGLKPFSEEDSIFFAGRDQNVISIIENIMRYKFAMITGSSGDGKSSLVFAGVLPYLKSGLLNTKFTKWTVAAFRPERQPLKNLAKALATALRMEESEEIEHNLSYGYSALVDIYKESSLYCDTKSASYLSLPEEQRQKERRRAANLVVLVDQFEEFFTNSENYREGVASPLAQITVNVLIETIRIAQEEDLPIYVLFTMRSDYIGQCVAFRGFPELIGQSTFFVPRLKRNELQEVIEVPLQLNNDKINPRLVQRLLNDLGDGIDQLPVLQHCLYRIWVMAQNGKEELDLFHYACVGGLASNRLPEDQQKKFELWLAQLPTLKQGLFEKPKLRNVIGKHATELYLTAHQYLEQKYQMVISAEDARFIIQVAFTCLTKIDENRAVRNRATLQEIVDMINHPKYDYVWVGNLLNYFREPGNSFLQPHITEEQESRFLLPHTVLDITHESLIRNWELLIEWADKEHRSASIYKDFKVQINRWLQNDKSEKYLLNSGLFAYFNDWYQSQKPTPAWIKRYMESEEINPNIDLLEQARDYLYQIEEYLRKSKAKIQRNKRLTYTAIGIIVTLMVFASYQAYKAYLEAEKAKQQKEIAEIEKQRAIQAKIIADINAKEAERQKLIAERNQLIADSLKKIAIGEKITAQDRQRLAEKEARLRALDKEIAEQKKALAEKQKEEAEKTKIAALKQKEEALTTAEIAKKNEIKATEEKEVALKNQSLYIASLVRDQVNHNKAELGLLLALWGLPENIEKPSRPYVPATEAALYYAANALINATPKLKFIGHKNKVVYLSFSEDGSRLVSTSWDLTAKVWEVASGRLLASFLHNDKVMQAKFCENNQLLLTVPEEFEAYLWDIRTQSRIATYSGHSRLISAADVSPNIIWVATGAQDNMVRLFEAKTGNLKYVFKGHKAPITHVLFYGEDKLISASQDGILKIWNTNTGDLIATVQAHLGKINSIKLHSSISLLATAGADNTAKVWNVNSLSPIITFSQGASVNDLDFSPDGAKLLISSKDRTLKIANLGIGKLVANLKEVNSEVVYSQFNSNNQFILSLDTDSWVKLWDAQNYTLLATFKKAAGNDKVATISHNHLAVLNPNYLTIELYQLLPLRQELINYCLRNLKKRELSEEEIQKYNLSE
ncbi:MAG: hypothetical protein RML72_12865 [Bacteroidia bacterium]|nr:hypothetical protein [Bacteroidia bacterium]MDW8159750.1 hypothetical protein [Bacteroidia bacterium]